MKKRRYLMVIGIIGIVSLGVIGCGKPTAEELKKDIENQKFSSVVKVYEKLEIEDKEKTDEYLTVTIAKMLTDYRIGERTEEDKEKIVKEIEKIEKMPGVSKRLLEILGASKSVIGDYYLNQQTFNTATKNIENPEDALQVYNLLQEACKNDPELLEQVNIKINEVSSKITTKITKGSKINAGGFDINFNKFEFSYDVLPKNTSSFYTHYEADKGKVYYHIAMDLKNNNKQNIGGDKILEAELVYKDDYKYQGFVVLDKTDDSGFDYANITSIKPLEKRGIRILFDLPEEIETSKDSVEINIKIDGKIYKYKMR